MREVRTALRYQPVEPVLEVAARRGVRVLLDREAGRGVLDHHRAQPLSNARACNHVLETIREFKQSLTRRVYLDLRYHFT